MKMYELLEMIRRNDRRITAIENKLGIEVEDVTETVAVHEEKIKGLELALEAHDKNTNKHRPVDPPPNEPPGKP